MTSRRVRQAVSLVRRLNRRSGVPEAELGERLGGSQEGYRRVLTRAVTQGYLMRKNHKYYFIPTEGIQLPSFVVMRRKARRRRSGRRRTGRGRSRRRSAGLYLEAVMNRSRRPARRRRRRARRHAAEAVSGDQQQQATAGSGAQNSASKTATSQEKGE